MKTSSEVTKNKLTLKTLLLFLMLTLPRELMEAFLGKISYPLKTKSKDRAIEAENTKTRLIKSTISKPSKKFTEAKKMRMFPSLAKTVMN